jgi:hypothetical protein
MWYHHPQWDQCQNWTALKAWNYADYVILVLKLLGLSRITGLWFLYCQTSCGFIYISTEWPKKMYTLFTHQYLWSKLWQCLDADGGHFEHLHWIQNSRTSLISIFLLYKYSSYDYRVIFFMSKCVYIILGHSVYVKLLNWDNISSIRCESGEFSRGRLGKIWKVKVYRYSFLSFVLNGHG